MRHPIILPISSFLPELISVGFLSAVGKVTHWQIFSSWQLACLTIRLSFLWFVLFCFVLPYIIDLSSFFEDASESQPAVCGTQMLKICWGHHALWPKAHCGPSLPHCRSHPHLLSIGWDSGPPDSVSSPPSITLPFPHYSHTVVANGRLWWKIGNCAPFPIQDSELSLSPIVLISIFSSFFPFPLSV